MDFQNIRQIHIVDPWYNMNRIEQIIGRGVRTFSHKSLPFQERNVEIYMYATLLDEIEFESVDLYVYRLAEKKAIQIGEVSRILKETSVDCILHHEQNNFTEENMKTLVALNLSSGKKIKYRVGDKPYSSICDYKESCYYTCQPDSNDKKINKDTYSLDFINFNLNSIIKRIKFLFKDRYFYNKYDLIHYIKSNKNYPNSQILSALDLLINDKNEFIVDYYGRQGNLINIGNYYMFQPIELDDERISIYERKVPLQYKHEKIVLDIPEKISEKIIDETNTKQDKASIKKEAEILQIIKNLKDDFTLATTHDGILKKAELNWYKLCNLTILKLQKENIPYDLLITFLIEHQLDTLEYNKKRLLLQYILNIDVLDPYEKLLKAYFDNKIFNIKDKTGILLIENQKPKFILIKEKQLIDAKDQDYKVFIPKFQNLVYNNFNKIIGFIIQFKNENYNIFKMKNFNVSRNKGTRCDQLGKDAAIKYLNLIVGFNKYNDENLRNVKLPELCSYQEFLLRYYDHINKDKKKWFLNNEEAVLNDIEKKIL